LTVPAGEIWVIFTHFMRIHPGVPADGDSFADDFYNG
jgi:hypothetical protein